MQLSNKELADIAIKLAQKAVDLLQCLSKENIQVNQQNGKDIKLQADIESEAIVIHELYNKTGIAVLSEEHGMLGDYNEDSYLWVVDPLDGSLNFSRGIPLYCISIGLWKAKEPILGVIIDIVSGDVYQGIVGEKCYLNLNEIKISERAEIGQSIICTGFPVYNNLDDSLVVEFVKKIQAFKKVRLLGSAAMSLCMVAKGSSEVYSENRIGFWDVAAGIALVLAAGGKCDYIFCEDNSSLLYVWASNGNIS